MCDTRPFGYRCTCPSKKQPCKHVLALLVLWAGASPAVPDAPAPAEIAAWLASRAGSEPSLADLLEGRSPVELRATAAGRAAGPADPEATMARADPEAAAARAEARIGRIRDGMGELELWLGDLIRHGLGWAASQRFGFWDAMAARLVDASAPGAATKLRDLAAFPHTGEGWPGRMLGAVARLHLLAAGWARYLELPESTQADLRTAAGWAWPASAVVASADREQDRWYVLARVTDDDPQLRVQRSWMWGLEHGRPALIVDFARPGSPFAWQLWPGQVLPAEVARYPGSAPLRVLVTGPAPDGGDEPAGAPPGLDSLSEVAAERGRALAADPWLERWPVSVRDVVPLPEPGGGWAVGDRDGDRVPLRVAEPSAWRLAAVSAGQPIHLLGEWDGDAVVPLGAWAEGRMVVL